MPRASLNLLDPADLQAVQGQWRYAPGLVPGEPNEGLVSRLEGSPARLADYDDSDYGELWIDGECDRERGTVQGFNVPQRAVVSTTVQPGDQHTIALLAINGPLAAPGGAVFVRYATLAFEWRQPGF